MTSRRQRQIYMTPAELAVAGESIYGSRWRAPLARSIGLSDRMIQYYITGEQPIPAERANHIRSLADIGQTGLIIRASIRKAAPDLQLYRAHKVARQILADLSAAGILPDQSRD